LNGFPASITEGRMTPSSNSPKVLRTLDRGTAQGSNPLVPSLRSLGDNIRTNNSTSRLISDLERISTAFLRTKEANSGGRSSAPGISRFSRSTGTIRIWCLKAT
jgi:hypothetical protein